jgi:hypothetical protein
MFICSRVISFCFRSFSARRCFFRDFELCSFRRSRSFCIRSSSSIDSMATTSSPSCASFATLASSSFFFVEKPKMSRTFSLPNVGVRSQYMSHMQFVHGSYVQRSRRLKSARPRTLRSLQQSRTSFVVSGSLSIVAIYFKVRRESG